MRLLLRGIGLSREPPVSGMRDSGSGGRVTESLPLTGLPDGDAYSGFVHGASTRAECRDVLFRVSSLLRVVVLKAHSPSGRTVHETAIYSVQSSKR